MIPHWILDTRKKRERKQKDERTENRRKNRIGYRKVKRRSGYGCERGG